MNKVEFEDGFFGFQLLSKANIIKILHQSNFERFVYESEDFVVFGYE